MSVEGLIDISDVFNSIMFELESTILKNSALVVVQLFAFFFWVPSFFYVLLVAQCFNEIV